MVQSMALRLEEQAQKMKDYQRIFFELTAAQTIKQRVTHGQE